MRQCPVCVGRYGLRRSVRTARILEMGMECIDVGFIAVVMVVLIFSDWWFFDCEDSQSPSLTM